MSTNQFFVPGVRQAPDEQGLSVRRLLDEGLSVSAWLDLFASAFASLEALHQKGILHRALCPETIWRLPSGEVGFSGLSKAFRIGEVNKEEELEVSPYTPPEYTRGSRSSFEVRADLYSLGAVLYEAIAGRPPFAGATSFELILSILESPPLRPIQLNPLCSPELDSLLLSLLQKSALERPASSREVAQRLGAMSVASSNLGLASTMHHTPDETKNSSPVGTGPTQLSPRETIAAELVLQSVDKELYERAEELGRGGLGRVTRATDTRLGRRVAIKELLREQGQARARFLREAKITAQLQHPGIVPIYEAGVWPSGEPFYAMKLIEGESFEKTILRAGSLQERLALLPRVISAA
jgi:serine/threonine protein kinase